MPMGVPLAEEHVLFSFSLVDSSLGPVASGLGAFPPSQGPGGGTETCMLALTEVLDPRDWNAKRCDSTVNTSLTVTVKLNSPCVLVLKSTLEEPQVALK